MISLRNLAISVFGAVLSAPPAYSQDLSRYREFQLGTNLHVVAKLIRVKPSEARAIHERPAMIQELEWKAPFSGSSQPADSVGNILFGFYNGALYHLVITYDRERTEGLTAEDIVEALSAKYGAATRPGADVVISSTFLYNDGEKMISDRSEKVIARWEDAHYSLDLFQSSIQTTFGLVVYSKPLHALARSAIAEAVRLDEKEAPQREITRQQKKNDEQRLQQEKARSVNKPPFRP